MIIFYVVAGLFAVVWVTVFIRIAISIFKNAGKALRGLKDGFSTSNNNANNNINSEPQKVQYFCEYCSSKIENEETKCKHCGAPITK